MTPDEKELRRALEARGGSPSAEFRARLSQALSSRPATPNLMPAVALVIAVALTVTSVGILLASRGLRPHEGPASSARVTSPTPTTPSAVPTPSSVVLSAPSANVVWALADNNHLYRSTDQGNHWEQRSVFAGPFRSASFIDDHEGWILDAGAAATECQPVTPSIAHTVDAGGLMWQQLPAKGIDASHCATGMWFFDAKHGFVSGWDRGGQPAVYRTSDGGNTFAATTLPDPPYFRPQPGVASSSRAAAFTLQISWMKQFGSTFYLEAVGSQNDPNLPPDNQFVLKSTDGGASWSLLTKVPSAAVVMVTESRWLDYTTPGQAMESLNGGQQFHPYSSDLTTAAPQLVFADADVGYAYGAGVIQRTLDGGAHWTTLPRPGTAPLPPTPPAWLSGAELSAPSSGVVWAIVGGKRLFRSTDQGKIWQERRAPRAPVEAVQNQPLISFIDANTGWELVPTSGDASCAQQQAEVWRTTDGAATWKLVSVTHTNAVVPPDIPTDQCKDAMYFRDATHGALVIGDPSTDLTTMFRTQDGGVTWNPQGFLRRADKGAFRVVSIISVDGTELMEAHANYSHTRYILESDGTVTVPDQAISNVVFLTGTHWLIVQPGLETTDAGQTWHPFTSDYSGPGDVAGVFSFAGDKLGYCTVRGQVYRTTSGGAHWELIKNSWP